MIEKKKGFMIHLLKTHFQLIFNPKHLEKHSKNFIKPIYDLQKYKKPP